MLTPEEVASRLQLSVATVRRRCSAGFFVGAVDYGTSSRSLWRIPEAAVVPEATSAADEANMPTPMLDRFLR